jgi:hypothetical protein
MHRAAPLRLSTKGVWLIGAMLGLVVSLPYIWLPSFQTAALRGDFANFWSAGATVGTPILTDRSRLAAWQAAHHLRPQMFVYPPPFAWFYAPFSHLSPAAGMIVADFLMLAFFVLAAIIAARAFGLGTWFSIGALFAWTPVIHSIEIGQNTALAVLLLFATIWALVNERAAIAGIAIGLLLYKPTIAIPLLLLVVARKQWRVVAVAAACGLGWYVLGLGTTHGDWLWPAHYAQNLYALRATELRAGFVDVPELLISAGLGAAAAVGLGYALLILAVIFLARRPILEGACVITLVGLALSPHANPYEAAMMLPAIFYAMLAVPEPWRTRVIAALYLLITCTFIPNGWWLAPLLVVGSAVAFLLFLYRRPRASAAQSAEPRIPGVSPLRLSPESVWLIGAMLAMSVSLPYIWLPWFQAVASQGDFANFWSAGATVGTPTFTDPSRLAAWQTAHHLRPQIFAYPPPFAWFYAPFSHLPPVAGMVVQDVLMLALLAAAAIVAARAFGFSTWFSLGAVLAWTPAINSIEIGQNTGLAVLLVFVAIWAFVNQRLTIAGIAIGLLLYKPTIAIPLLVLLAVCRQGRVLAVAAACGAGWYLLGLLATHGDWLWPAQYVRTLYAALESEGLFLKPVTLPELLIAAGLTRAVAAGMGYALLLLALPLVARRSLMEGIAVITLVGLAVSPHARPYELALMLPALFYAMLKVPEPWRTRIIPPLYLLVACGLIFDSAWWLMPVVLIAGAAAFVVFLRPRVAGSALPYARA